MLCESPVQAVGCWLVLYANEPRASSLILRGGLDAVIVKTSKYLLLKTFRLFLPLKDKFEVRIVCQDVIISWTASTTINPCSAQHEHQVQWATYWGLLLHINWLQLRSHHKRHLCYVYSFWDCLHLFWLVFLPHLINNLKYLIY